MRSSRAASLLELVVAAVMMAWAFALVGELVVQTTRAGTQLTNCIDGSTGATQFMSRLGSDVRAASAIGPPPLSDAATQKLITLGGGYPTGWGTTNSAQTLILQQPAVMNAGSVLDGVPLMIPAGSTGLGLPVNYPYLDVVQYQVLADPNSPKQYMIQEVRFSGGYTPAGLATTLRTAIPVSPAHIVLRGVIGPLQSGNPVPAVFNYNVPSGVAINLEVETPVPNNGVNVHHIGVHSEAYMRCAKNLYATNTY
jgi:hypothetical protein